MMREGEVLIKCSWTYACMTLHDEGGRVKMLLQLCFCMTLQDERVEEVLIKCCWPVAVVCCNRTLHDERRGDFFIKCCWPFVLVLLDLCFRMRLERGEF